MRLTNVLQASPPKFKFWSDFGYGKQRRYPFHKYWRIQWRNRVAKIEIKDHRLQPEDLPNGTKVVQAKSLIDIPIGDTKPILYNHPWPYEDTVDTTKERPAYNYNKNTRFFVPLVDCANLTNTIITTDPRGLLESLPEHLSQEYLDSDIVEAAQRRYDWAIENDFTLIALPRKREYPRIDQRPKRKYGISNERMSHNVLFTLNEFTATLLASRYAQSNDIAALSSILGISTISFPKVVVPQERDERLINFYCEMDFATLGLSPLLNPNHEPRNTKNMDLPSMNPRSWPSLLEQTNNYSDDWDFVMPDKKFVQTIMISPRIIRNLDEHEMLDKITVSSYTMALQCARHNYASTSETNYRPLENPINNGEALPDPITLQCIGFDSVRRSFHFGRFQLNSANPSSLFKNQLWYSGPITDFGSALAYMLSFQAYGQNPRRDSSNHDAVLC